MKALFASGEIAYLALAILVAEVVLLVAIRRRRGRGPAIGSVIANGLSGAGLLFALRAALVHASWPEVALWLLLALIAHAVDIVSRWRGAG